MSRKVKTKARAAARSSAKARKAPAKSVGKAAKTRKPKAAATRKVAKSARKPAASARKPAAPARKPAATSARKPAPVVKAPAAAKPASVAVKPAPLVVKPAPVVAQPKPVPHKPASHRLLPPKPQPAPTAQNGVETQMQVKKPAPRSEFKTGEHIVYPAHGVGRIMGVDTQEVAGIKLDLFVISFIKDKMTLRVPVAKATAVGMRKLADQQTVKRALETVRGRARIKRTLWSRRAQEYEAKINSGDLISIAEVVRDLYRSETQPEQSYSERQLYEAALDRMSREISSVQRISETEAIRQIEQNLAKSPRRGVKPEGVVDAREQAA
jgi:CarD family transcriptional regulator